MKNIALIINNKVEDVAVADDTTDPKLFGPEWEDVPDDVSIGDTRMAAGSPFSSSVVVQRKQTLEEAAMDAYDKIETDWMSTVFLLTGCASSVEIIFKLASSAQPLIAQQNQQKAADFLTAYEQARRDVAAAVDEPGVTAALTAWAAAVTTATT